MIPSHHDSRAQVWGKSSSNIRVTFLLSAFMLWVHSICVRRQEEVSSCCHSGCYLLCCTLNTAAVVSVGTQRFKEGMKHSVKDEECCHVSEHAGLKIWRCMMRQCTIVQPCMAFIFMILYFLSLLHVHFQTLRYPMQTLHSKCPAPVATQLASWWSLCNLSAKETEHFVTGRSQSREYTAHSILRWPETILRLFCGHLSLKYFGDI